VSLAPPKIIPNEPAKKVTGASKRLYNPAQFPVKEKSFEKTVDNRSILHVIKRNEILLEILLQLCSRQRSLAATELQ
jgi:hypothetical protein